METKRPIPTMKVHMDRRLSEDDLKMLTRIEPATVSKMIRQRVAITNHSVSSIKNWLRDNITSLYYQPYEGEVWFESDEDLVLFIAAFHNKSRRQS